MIDLVKGYKTYLVMAAAALVIGFHALGYIPDRVETEALKVLGAAGGATIAAKVNRLSQLQS